MTTSVPQAWTEVFDTGEEGWVEKGDIVFKE